MNNQLPYCFTSYGEVYSGEDFSGPQFPDHKILIQRSKISAYNNLPGSEKTIEKINEYGIALPYKLIKKEMLLCLEETDKLRKREESKKWYESDRSTMFILGAGASANCVFGDDLSDFKKDLLRPPLGPHLFDKKFKPLYSKYPGVKDSLHFLQDDNGADIESLLEDEWKEVSHFGNESVIARHINIQYYLQELLKEVSSNTLRNHYSKNLFGVLTERLSKLYHRNNKRKFAFVSFNQDTILDSFLTKSFNVALSTLDDYVKINEYPFCLFKPHGSWNWGWKFPNLESKSITTPEWLYLEKVNYYKLYFELLGDYTTMIDWHSYTKELQMNSNRVGKHTVNKSNLSVIHPGNENLYFPSLLIPYRDKDEFTMPTSHFWDLQHCMSYVEKLVIIGWKGNERHFNQLLESRGINIKKVIIVDPCPDAVLKQLPFLATAGIEITEFKGGFETFVKTGLDEEFPLP